MESGTPDGAPPTAQPGGAAVNRTPATSSNPASVEPATSEASGSAGTRTDAALVAGAREGDARAFRALYDRYHGRLFAMALGVVKNRQDAMDVVQETFVKVHKNLDRFEGSSSFYTWSYRIGMNLAIDHIRKKKRGRELEYDDAIGHGDDAGTRGDAGGADAFPGAQGEAGPRQGVLRKELGGAIADALGTLSEHHRAVILLREVEGYSYEEMAQALDVPKGTIMSRLFHARRKMQAALEAYLDDDPVGPQGAGVDQHQP